MSLQAPPPTPGTRQREGSPVAAAPSGGADIRPDVPLHRASRKDRACGQLRSPATWGPCPDHSPGCARLGSKLRNDQALEGSLRLGFRTDLASWTTAEHRVGRERCSPGRDSAGLQGKDPV